ncbi:hypothetical protein ACHAWX_005779 [Stephanocyclus meneghinianus]
MNMSHKDEWNQMQRHPMHLPLPTCSESSTQTDSQNQDLQNLSSPTLKSLAVQTDPCDLRKYKIIDESDSREYDGECDDDATFEFNRDHELQRRLNPTIPEDFEKLQTELMQWRQRQERKINMTARNAEQKQAMMSTLLNKEACILRKIASLQHVACEKWRADRLENIMEKMSRPKQWGVADGTLCVDVDTPETVRAREMKNMYEELRKTVDDEARSRVELLHRAKALIEELGDHSSLAKDICSLIDRESEMLHSTELGNELMAGLRKRMLNAFAKLATKTRSLHGMNLK